MFFGKYLNDDEDKKFEQQNFRMAEVSNLKKDVNQDSHITPTPISQISFFEEVRCLILASSQRKLREHIEFLKFDNTIKQYFLFLHTPYLMRK